ncbi:MAG: pyrimidine 5'-nucleotidase [Mariprofundaceae bacterium]|nr:pyrimidine 5'-nucleotidase [Mariprofundaceae bacterium]
MPFDLVVVDLDNTLYAANNGVFARMDKRMTAFICNALNMQYEEANALRVGYWREYGTTLRGLILHHGIEPEAFLHDVHDVNVHELLCENLQLNEALHQLPGRKVIHTNGIYEHAERVLNALGVRHHFEIIYDIRYNAYMPKPSATTLKMLLHDEGVSPVRTLVLDDMQENLVVAKELGARTCWVTTEQPQHDWDYQVSEVEELATYFNPEGTLKL